MNNQHSKISIPFFLAAYLIYINIICIHEIFNFSMFCLGLNQTTPFTIIGSILLAFLLCFFVYKKDIFSVKRPSFCVPYILLSSIIILFYLYKMTQPDTSADIRNYHILAQIPNFIDNFHENFAPGDFQLFGFRLPDRLFYLFRIILGYRCGTIFNLMVALLIFSQLIEIIRNLLSQFKQEENPRFWFLKKIFLNEYFLAFTILFTVDVVNEIPTYMVELAALPIALEAVNKCLFPSRSDYEPYYMAYLLGIYFAMKMTNIVFILPILLCYLISRRHILNVKKFILCFIIAILPVWVYLIYNFKITGNPVFPYFNKIFKSPYFPSESNWRDMRWGPATLSDYLLWPIYMIFRPEYRQSEIPNRAALSLLPGLIGTVYAAILIFRNYWKKTISSKNKSGIILLSIAIISYILWIFSTGHTRYFILGSLLIELCYVYCLPHLKKGFAINLSILLSVLLLLQPIVAIAQNIRGVEWSWRSSNKIDRAQNVKYTFNDKSFPDKYQKIDLFLMNNLAYGSFAYLINPNATIIYEKYLKDRINSASIISSIEVKINNYFASEKNVYDLDVPYSGTPDSLADHINTITDNGYFIESVETVDGYFNSFNELWLLKLSKKSQKNTFSYFNNEIKIDVPHTGIVNLTGFYGLWGCYSWGLDGQLIVYKKDLNTNSETMLLQHKIEESQIYQFNNSFSVNANEELWIKYVGNDSNTLPEPYHVFLINVLAK